MHYRTLLATACSAAEQARAGQAFATLHEAWRHAAGALERLLSPESLELQLQSPSTRPSEEK